MLTAVGLTKSVLKYQFISVFMNLCLSITFVQVFGIEGVVLGTLVSNGVLWFPYTKLILATFNTSLSEWVHAIFLTALAAMVPQVVLFIASHYLFDLGHNQNILACGVATLIALTSSYKYVDRNHQFFIRVSKDSSKL